MPTLHHHDRTLEDSHADEFGGSSRVHWVGTLPEGLECDGT